METCTVTIDSCISINQIKYTRVDNDGNIVWVYELPGTTTCTFQAVQGTMFSFFCQNRSDFMISDYDPEKCDYVTSGAYVEVLLIRNGADTLNITMRDGLA